MLRITKSMHGSTIGLVRHLQSTNEDMHALYRHLDTLQKQGGKPSPEEIKVAGGRLPFEALGYRLDNNGNVITQDGIVALAEAVQDNTVGFYMSSEDL